MTSDLRPQQRRRAALSCIHGRWRPVENRGWRPTQRTPIFRPPAKPGFSTVRHASMPLSARAGHRFEVRDYLLVLATLGPLLAPARLGPVQRGSVVQLVSCCHVGPGLDEASDAVEVATVGGLVRGVAGHGGSSSARSNAA